MVCILKNPLYGLKQSSKKWSIIFNTFMKKTEYIMCKVNNYVYMRRAIDHHVYVYFLLYVDDMLIISRDMAQVDDINRNIFNEFKMKDLGKANKIIEIQIIRNRNYKRSMLSQQSYFQKKKCSLNMGCLSAMKLRSHQTLILDFLRKMSLR